MASAIRSVPRAALLLRRLSSRADRRVSVGQFHSPIVDELWTMRRAESEKETDAAVREADEMAAKPASASHTVVRYDFKSNPMLGEHYRNPYGSVRIGRVLEDLDALAGTIAFKHTKPRAPKRLMLVTASVDRITLLHNASTESDMTLSGSVAWVGRSSMVIRMLAHSHSVQEGRTPWLEADFTFVARDPTTRASTPINPLELCTEEARAVFAAIGEQVEAERASRAAPSCLDANSAAAAQLVSRASAALLMPALADPGAVLMSQTRQGNVFVCQPQHRNTADRIFGGLLMRRAYELAFATAFLFGGSRPQFIEVDRVRFVAPVEVGDLLKLEATVLYTTPKRIRRESARLSTVQPPEIHVEVVAHVTRPDARSVSVVNTFLLTFALPEAETVKTVLPSSVDEAQRMLSRMAAEEVQDRLRRAKP